MNETSNQRVPLPATGETLVLGWGNPGRRDDGLGPALIAAVEALGPPGARFDSDYQLQIENAAEVARYPRVVFVDADRGGHEPFSMRRLLPAAGSMSFSTHSVRPEAILALARDLFQAEPEAWLLGIHGYDFDDFGEGLSAGARANLAAATEFVERALTTNDLHEFGPQHREE